MNFIGDIENRKVLDFMQEILNQEKEIEILIDIIKFQKEYIKTLEKRTCKCQQSPKFLKMEVSKWQE